MRGHGRYQRIGDDQSDIEIPTTSSSSSVPSAPPSTIPPIAVESASPPPSASAPDQTATALYLPASETADGKGRYSAIATNPDESNNNANAVVAGSSSGPVDTGFALKVLCKEKVYLVQGLLPSSSIAKLKSYTAAATDINTTRQRLVFNGRQLRPDEKTLDDFKIQHNAVVHLFPLPLPVASPAPTTIATAVPIVSNSSNGNAAVLNPMFPTTGRGSPFVVTALPSSNSGAQQAATLLALQYDPIVAQSSREVRLWCIVLMFLSGMTLFNNLSFMTSTGRFGMGPLDSVVNIIDTLCSIGGLYVGNMGVVALRSLSIDEVKRYVRYLGILACCSVLLRILWVADVVVQVQAAVKASEAAAHAGGAGDGGSGNDNQNGGDGGSEEDDLYGEGGGDGSSSGNTNVDAGDSTDTGTPALDPRMVITLGIQATIIAAVCTFAWISCYMRAQRLQHAVQSHPSSGGTRRVIQV